MKKIVLIALLSTISSIYPIIVQTVVLKSKITGKEVVLYGDMHESMVKG